MYIVIIILAVISYPISCFYQELFYTICDAILDAILANFFFIIVDRARNYSMIQKKKRIAKPRRWDYRSIRCCRFSTAVSKALNFPLWFESRAPWTIFNFSPPNRFGAWQMEDSRLERSFRRICAPLILRRLIDRWSCWWTSKDTAGRNLEDS